MHGKTGRHVGFCVAIPWEKKMLKTAKKVQSRAITTTKASKKSVEISKASVRKKKSDSKVVASKALSSKTLSKASPKAGKTVVVTKLRQKANGSVKAKGATAPKVKNKRKNRELSSAEYNAFVVKAAQKAQVLPETLVTVDRRKSKPAVIGKPVAEQVTKSDEIREPRQKTQRRRQIDPTTCERDYSLEEIEFMNALDEYKRNSGRMFPTCSEILEVFRGLGYQRLSHDENVEVDATPESDDVNITVTEVEYVDKSWLETEL
jgi:hypothetical protein